MRIIFVRHGEPNYEKDCLTEAGHLQASAVAERLREEEISAVWSSPLGRARETADVTASLLNLPVQTLDFMRELHWAAVTGLPCSRTGTPGISRMKSPAAEST